MSLNRLENCIRCGELYVHVSKDICPKCLKKVEHEYELCTRFLRKKENRSSTITEMSEKTGVSLFQITEFIREKRLLIDSAPNMRYSCEGCGELIREGRLCSGCKNHWKQAISEDDVQKSEERKPRVGYYIDEHKSK